jgi:uncharacterized membrane protein (UPF0136 family)
MTTVAIIALVATLALGVASGVLYLQRARRGWVVEAHLYVAVAAGVIVLAAAAMAPANDRPGPSGVLTAALVAAAVAAGYGALRYVRGRTASELVLAMHIVLGIAGFFVFLAFAKRFAVA